MLHSRNNLTNTWVCFQYAVTQLTQHFALQITGLHKLDDRKYSCSFTTDTEVMKGVLTSQVTKELSDGTLSLKDGDVVTLTNYLCNLVGSDHRLIAMELRLESSSSASEQAGAGQECGMLQTPQAKVQPKVEKEAEHAAAKENIPANITATPGPAPSPSEE